MTRLNEYDRIKTLNVLTQYQWTYAVTIHAREPTWGGLWLSITQAMGDLCIDDTSTKYWMIGAQGFVTDKPHYHGVLYYERLTRRDINRRFKEVNSPILRPITDIARWVDYCTKQGVNETTITNIGE